MGWGGGGGGGYDRECLFNTNHDDDDNHDNDEYNNDNKYNSTKGGKGSCRGADDGGESDYDGCDVIRRQSFGGMGHRTSIVSPHLATAVINNKDDNNCRRGGGASCPPPLIRPIPPDAALCC